MTVNKYGGINDMPDGWSKEHNRIYRLWYHMLRRCYDDTQLSRKKGKSYIDCDVSNEWKYLSKFFDDVRKLPGYEQWLTTTGMVLDKDILGGKNKTYCKENCCFVPSRVNLAVMNKQNPNITYNANESHKVMYCLEKDGVRHIFNSEKEACMFLGVRQCSVAGAWRHGWNCKGYKIERIGAKMGGEQDDN